MERFIYIIRHGTTDWNASGRIQGHLDPPLNATGRWQAQLVSQRLAGLGATALYSSDLQRAYETAQIIGRTTGLRVVQKLSLREMHFGCWQGLTSQQIRERDPAGYAARRADPYDVPPPEGETWRRFYDRAVRSLEEILATTAAGRVIVVTHSGVCTALGLRALGLDCTGKRTFGNENCSLHTLAVAGAQWRVVCLNDVAHLSRGHLLLPLADSARAVMARVLHLAVLLSGSGRTLENLQQAIDTGRLSARIAVVVSSKPDAYGLVHAQKYGVDTVTISRKVYQEVEIFNAAINAVLARYTIDLVVLAGFLSPYHPPSALVGKVLNVHPALLPAFGGKGYYGDRVHRAVLEAGVKVSGCTVHFADEYYDHGPIILQEAVPVLDDDTVETLSARVFAVECRLYPQAIQLVAEDRLHITGRRVRCLQSPSA